MRAWTCTTFKGHYPCSTAAVVVAECEKTALHWVGKELKRVGLKAVRDDGTPLDNTDLVPLPTSGRMCRVFFTSTEE